MRKFCTILAVVLVAGLAAAVAGYVHFDRLFPLLNAWLVFTGAAMMAKLSMALSGLVILAVAILAAVSLFGRSRSSAGNVRLVSLVLGLGALAFAGFAATIGYTSVQQAMAVTGVTDSIVTAPSYLELMLVLILGLVAPTVAAISGALLADGPAEL